MHKTTSLNDPNLPSDGAVSKSHWAEVPTCGRNVHGPKDVRAIEVRLLLFGFIVNISIKVHSFPITS